MNAPLEGVRVVELAHYVAVPAAGAMLADFGADVIQVEIPQGEVYRHGRLKYFGYESEFSEYPAFQMDNRGKRSIALDLTRPEALAALYRLIERAEIFITNMLPSRRERFEVDHKSLLARWPRLIVGAISGYGLGGEESDRPAFDYAAYWARTGMMDVMRDEGVAPSMQRPAVGDHAAAMNLVCGILAAMRLRDADGRGQYVDVSLLQTGLHILGNDVANSLVARQPTDRHDRRVPRNALWNSYPVKDGRWVMLVMIAPDAYWPKFCRALDRPDLIEDERFADPWHRSENAAALVEELESAFARRTLAEWEPILDAAGLIWAPVRTLDEVVHDPQARALGYFYELEHPTAGRFETVGPPLRIEGVELGARSAAPPLNAHAREILREAELEEEEIEKLL